MPICTPTAWARAMYLFVFLAAPYSQANAQRCTVPFDALPALGTRMSNASMAAMAGRYSSACSTAKRAIEGYEELIDSYQKCGDQYMAAQIEGMLDTVISSGTDWCEKAAR